MNVAITDLIQWLAGVHADPGLPQEVKLYATELARNAQQQPDGTWIFTVDDD